jgi:hypothetical protein
MIKMNIQNLMKEAQKMQKDLLKTQEELNNTEYTGESSAVTVVVNGSKNVKSISINMDEDISKDDIEMLEDMILVAVNDAMKKADQDKEKKMSKYGSAMSGLM